MEIRSGCLIERPHIFRQRANFRGWKRLQACVTAPIFCSIIQGGPLPDKVEEWSGGDFVTAFAYASPAAVVGVIVNKPTVNIPSPHCSFGDLPIFLRASMSVRTRLTFSCPDLLTPNPLAMPT